MSFKMADEEFEGNQEKGEDNVYNEEGREELVDSEELSPEEAGFMKGYDEADEEKEEDTEEKKEEEE